MHDSSCRKAKARDDSTAVRAQRWGQVVPGAQVPGAGQAEAVQAAPDLHIRHLVEAHWANIAVINGITTRIFLCLHLLRPPLPIPLVWELLCVILQILLLQVQRGPGARVGCRGRQHLATQASGSRGWGSVMGSLANPHPDFVSLILLAMVGGALWVHL